MLKRYFPILEWLPRYKKAYLAGDLSAGFTVGIMLIPQGMAYAMIAGLPPVFGLYAALLPQVVYALMGTAPKLSIGAVAIDSLVVASGLGALALSGIDEYIAMAIFLALFVGVIQLAFGFFRMGFLANFLSEPVISGFTSAAAIIIGLSQLHHLLGLNVQRGGRILFLLRDTVANIGQTHLLTLLIGVLAIAVISLLPRLSKKIPAALIVVVVSISIIYFLQLGDVGVRVVGEIPGGLPTFKIPVVGVEKIWNLAPIAITLALLSFVEAVSIAKGIEAKDASDSLRPNQELLALGASNIAGSFFQAYSVTAGFSRTAVNVNAGAKTGIASLISAMVVGLILLFLTPVFQYLPNAVLAAIILVAVYGLIDVRYAVGLYKSRKDEFALLMVTFLITLGVGIIEGIVLGVLFSLALLVYRTSKPHIAVLGRIRGTEYFKNINRFSEDIEVFDEILILRFDSQLYFANKDYFKKELYKNMGQKGEKLKYVILNAESIDYIDSTAVTMLKQVLDDFQKKGITLLVTGAIGPTRDILFESGLAEKIGSENLFVRTFEAFEYCQSLKEKTPLQSKISEQSGGSRFVT
ncbi:MAG: sodium-independent anion transporter [Muricauda sp.]|nr:solute carrier family 26 protein [Allomuricauda sp.]MAU26404.1 sodium-independent anion transporter [Allomuricauda sp.]MBC29514.1 sodium-independent anion transporter [Allomuricauda sp.]|tara:strand:+ start:61 stop:1800 length:1740 start_codon:yes stop_codon:yes gene_type:complete